MLRYYFYQIRWYLGLAALLCLGITVMKYSSWIDRSLFGSPQPPPAAAQPADPPATTTPSATAPAFAGMDAPSQLAKADSMLSEAAIQVSAALKEILTWQTEVEPLRDRVLEHTPAEENSDKLVERLAYVMRGERVTAEELSDAGSRIEALRRKVSDLTQQSDPEALTADELVEISELHSICRQASEDWQRSVQQALAITHLMQRESAAAVASAEPATLGGKLDDADAAAAVADLDEQIQLEKEQEMREREREAALAEQKRQQEQEQAELLARATSPEVRALLAPFLEPRDVQPQMSGASIKFRRTVEKQPMSLAALHGINALADSTDGLKRLALLGGHRKLPAPKWAVNSQPNNWSDDDKEMLKTAQQMLRDYGPVLVKAGLLSE